jgi:hypothetical protein
MKVYFVGSISGKDKYFQNYNRIVDFLKKEGHKVYEITLKPSKGFVYNLSDEEKVEQYKRVLSWITDADVIVAECSYSSLGVGYEISLALEKGKPVVALYEEGHAPHFIEGIKSEKLAVVKYSLDDLHKTLKDAIEFVSEQMDVRFNFFVSPRIVNYLDWIAKQRKMPRAVYLRRLIEKDMVKNKDFSEEN